MSTPAAPTFRVRLLRPITTDGMRWVTSAELLADALGAANLIRAGSARLVDDEDLPRLLSSMPERRPIPVSR